MNESETATNWSLQLLYRQIMGEVREICARAEQDGVTEDDIEHTTNTIMFLGGIEVEALDKETTKEN